MMSAGARHLGRPRSAVVRVAVVRTVVARTVVVCAWP